MDILKEKLNVAEFQVYENELELSSEFNISTHYEFELYTKTKSTKADYGIRFNTLITNKNDNSKVLTYKSEWSAELHVENSLTDLINLRSFVENGFIKHQEYFNTNKPVKINMTNICDNSLINTFSSSILSQLGENGFYK